MSLNELFRADPPAIPVRGVHLDLKGTPPTFQRVLRLREVFAACRYNAVLVEWEDTFPWTADLRFRCETCYTPQQIVAFRDAAAELDLEVIPLVQCLGHMENPLAVAGYEHLREVPHRADVLNPLADGARELVRRMVDDVLAAFPKLRHFHLGGDEAWSFGTHADTKGYVEACVAALDELGERDRFEACKAAMERLSGLREAGWRRARHLRELGVMATLDARRRSGGGLVQSLAGLKRTLAEADDVAGEVRRAYAGLIEPIWIDRYLAERIEPLREELAALDARIHQLDAAGYAAVLTGEQP